MNGRDQKKIGAKHVAIFRERAKGLGYTKKTSWRRTRKQPKGGWGERVWPNMDHERKKEHNNEPKPFQLATKKRRQKSATGEKNYSPSAEDAKKERKRSGPPRKGGSQPTGDGVKVVT